MVCPDQIINIKLYIFVSSVIEESKNISDIQIKSCL